MQELVAHEQQVMGQGVLANFEANGNHAAKRIHLNQVLPLVEADQELRDQVVHRQLGAEEVAKFAELVEEKPLDRRALVDGQVVDDLCEFGPNGFYLLVEVGIDVHMAEVQPPLLLLRTVLLTSEFFLITHDCLIDSHAHHRYQIILFI